MEAQILYFAGWDIILFILLCLAYFPIIAFINTMIENDEDNKISTTQIIIGFICIFILLKLLLSNYGHHLWNTGN